MGIVEEQNLQISTSVWHGRIAADEGIVPLYRPDKDDGPLPDLADEGTRKALGRALFLRGLEQCTITRKPFENFIARLRRALVLSENKYSEVAAAVACYAFNTEYILDAGTDEMARLEVLRQDKGNAALLGCYVPLYTLPDAAGIRASLGDCALSRLQLDEPLALAKRRGAIEAVTEIDAGISAKVRAQYEESPYPRWSDTPKRFFDAGIRKLLPAAPEILVAGCGTGIETVQMALTLPEANILAVDLSRSSLAYAMGQAERLGIRNVKFRHGDILRFGSLGMTFDYISSQGVLHHMEDPLAGWRVLSGLLKPQGVMSLGLYSEAGRGHIAAARKEIARHGFPATSEGIRAFRRKAPEILPPGVVSELQMQNDYYFLSMCRDMLFHVQEQCFDIPRIADALRALGLDFLKFNSPFTPPSGTTLEDWRWHESLNPLIFRNMYKFWCRKASA